MYGKKLINRLNHHFKLYRFQIQRMPHGYHLNRFIKKEFSIVGVFSNLDEAEIHIDGMIRALEMRESEKKLIFAPTLKPQNMPMDQPIPEKSLELLMPKIRLNKSPKSIEFKPPGSS